MHHPECFDLIPKETEKGKENKKANQIFYAFYVWKNPIRRRLQQEHKGTHRKNVCIYILYNIKEMEIEKEKKSQRRNKMKIHFLQWTRWDVEPNQRKGWLTTHKHHILVRETQRKSPCTLQEWSGTKRNPLMRYWRPRRRAREREKKKG